MFKLNTSLHKWLSLLVGIQLLIWLGTGLYFNLMDHQKASGSVHLRSVDHNAATHSKPLMPLSQLAFDNAKQLKLLWILGHPYYQLTFESGAHGYQHKDVTLVDAHSGDIRPLSETLVRTIALKSYDGAVSITSAHLLTPPIDELPREENPVWQVKLDDANHTNVYIEASSGAVLGHFNDDRRLHDLMLKLHFMDYFNTGGFNHWLIIVFAIASLLLSMTGITWLVERFKSGQLRIMLKPSSQQVTVTDQATAQSSVLTLSTQETLFDALAQHNVLLPSNCGGGGTCGLCRIHSEQALKITPPEQARLSKSKLAEGYRLACQHKASEVTHITVRTNKESAKAQ
ncbi:PepSY domain-containing protein [Pseudoalteromonas sp. T1lg23B]|uniref:PepSY domain-containing protein n=1 Tax=Pseudoalteromonas sp. T1lg23B TaxID=2077097 RepID=UPI000CF63D35|nr:PepSY domain-containing protein [Pseudoalteromonas sp. T1lg23B]